jgi:hypothetical protein
MIGHIAFPTLALRDSFGAQMRSTLLVKNAPLVLLLYLVQYLIPDALLPLVVSVVEAPVHDCLHVLCVSPVSFVQTVVA